MLEKEIKILEVDTSYVVQLLVGHGAEMTFDGHISDTYYDFKDRVKYKREEAQKIFRLRQKWDTSIYTVKNKKRELWEEEGVVVNEEYETIIADTRKFIKALKKEGMIPIRKKKKHRMSFKLGNVAFDFDTYEGIPTFLEIEGPSAKVIHNWIDKLLLQGRESLVWGSRMLFDRYKVPYMYCD